MTANEVRNYKSQEMRISLIRKSGKRNYFTTITEEFDAFNPNTLEVGQIIKNREGKEYVFVSYGITNQVILVRENGL